MIKVFRSVMSKLYKLSAVNYFTFSFYEVYSEGMQVYHDQDVIEGPVSPNLSQLQHPLAKLQKRAYYHTITLCSIPEGRPQT